ncbi:LysM peptidoglycan-binding domain-containing protein [Rhizobium leguminosarum bv. viciae]|uniref:LysM peptidoglycan-binding domain-containing protein n=1 Tax=Rhizobium leguminosarum TaxID=384 RepID=UPI00144241CA|nr:LysM peptidoglycan-binding domain-containing protein [Rhizobium leguminosarum]NKK84281.1 LysM peptidoglycan-binding domain-containing protein [Rhizobium leguminosarum bv. viciae]
MRLGSFLIGCGTSFSLIALSLPSIAATTAPYPDLSVETPLDTKEALAALVLTFGDSLPPKFTEYAHNILLFGYHIEPLVNCPSDYVCAGLPPSTFLVFRRTVRYSLSDVTKTLGDRIQQLDQDGCSKLHIDNPRLEIAVGDVMQYGTDAHFKKRKCAFNNSITYASGSAKATMRVVLDRIPPSYQPDEYLGEVKIGAPDVQISDVNSKLFELIDIGTFKGYLISGLIGGFRLTVLNKIVSNEVNRVVRNISDFDASKVLAFFNSGLTSFNKFIALLSYVENARPNYFNANGTMFGCAPSGCYIQFSQEQYIAVSQAQGVYAQKVCEIETLRSFKEKGEKISVGKGDTLWSIANDRLCSGELYQYLIYVNPLVRDPNHLKVGTIVDVPPLYRFLALGRDIIQTGDSLWTRYSKSKKALSWSEYRDRHSPGRDPSLIYPLQVSPIDP